MTPEQKIKKVKDDIMAESTEDFIGLWEFIGYLHGEFPDSTAAQRRRMTIKLVQEMLEEDMLHAGKIAKDGRRFIRWPGTTTEIMQRIERQWNKLDREPTIADIVWFSSKQ